MNIKGKSIGIIGSIISVTFSLIGIGVLSVFISMTKSQEFIDSYNTEYLNRGGNMADATAALDALRGLLSFGQIVTYIILLLGIIAFILTLVTKLTNKRGVAIVLLIISIFHIFSLRILSFALLLTSSRQLSKDYSGS